VNKRQPGALLDRARRLGLLDVQHPLLQQIEIQQLTEDEYMAEYIEQELARLEAEMIESPFLKPKRCNELQGGDIEIVETDEGERATISFVKGKQNFCTHLFVTGQSGSGKSCLQGNVAAAAANDCFTLVMDTTKSFRHFLKVRQSHRFVRLEDLVINPWDVPSGVSPHLVDEYMNHEICATYGLKFAEYELSEVVRDLRDKGTTPNLPAVIGALKRKKYKGYSKRQQYNDSALLVLSNLYRTTGSLFRCAIGMNLEKLIHGNVVVEIDTIPEHQVLIIRLFFTYLMLLTKSGRKLEKPLVFMIDEGQMLLS